MVEISNAAVNWDAQKKQWVIRLEIGGEVIKRPAPEAARETIFSGRRRSKSPRTEAIT